LRPGAFDTLVALYDTKPDVETRRHIVDSLGMSQDPRALEKLFSIAQSDPDRDVRHHAVDSIAMH
jgi:HEAT repeat protein